MAKWIFDPDHSVAAFVVRHLMVTNVHGQFNSISGTLDFDPASRSLTAIEVEIGAAGIYTGIGKRDAHLASPDFLDAANHPIITFRSSMVQFSGGKGCVTGDLTIRGITRPVTLDVEMSGPIKIPEDIGGETSIGLAAQTTINREDFNVMWNAPLYDGGLMVGREVKIYLEIEADLEE